MNEKKRIYKIRPATSSEWLVCTTHAELLQQIDEIADEDDVAEIEILNQTTDRGQFRLYILSSDTLITAKQYRYDIWVTFPADDTATPVVRPSLFEVRPAVTVLGP